MCSIIFFSTLFLTRSTARHVFDDFTWDMNGPAYSKFDSTRWIPSRIPLTAVISGTSFYCVRTTDMT